MVIQRALGFVICAIAVVLPNLLRNLFSELLGWITQFLYMNYYYLLRFMVKELEKAKAQAGSAPERTPDASDAS
jgi:hypothetical protein